MRHSHNVIDNNGIIKSGYDYNLQVWVRDYKILALGLGFDLDRNIAGKDIRNAKNHEVSKGGE